MEDSRRGDEVLLATRQPFQGWDSRALLDPGLKQPWAETSEPLRGKRIREH
jgi:hypothetical protein